MERTLDPEVRDLLQRVLGDPQSRTLAALLRSARFHAFRTRDTLVYQGDEPAVLVLLDGCVAVRRASPEGRLLTLRLMMAGQVAGLRSISRPEPSPDRLVALTDGRLCRLQGSTVRFCAEADPALAMRLFDLSIEAADLLSERLDESVFERSRKRLALILLTYEPYLGAVGPILSRQDLAGLIGTSREMLGSIIRSMEAEHLIVRHGRRIEIRDRDALEREADGGGRREHLRSALAIREEPSGAVHVTG